MATMGADLISLLELEKFIKKVIRGYKMRVPKKLDKPLSLRGQNFHAEIRLTLCILVLSIIRHITTLKLA